MSHIQYPTTLTTLNENNTNRRSQSSYTQICTNYPPSHSASTQAIPHSSSAMKFPTDRYASHCKENITQPFKKTLIHLNSEDVGTQLKMENERLRKQIQQQRDHYQQEINKLKKNIAMKDQLLDQCEAEIGNLKFTYHKFIIQNRHSHTENTQSAAKGKQEHELAQKQMKEGEEGASKVESGLIPLSIVPKRSSSTAGLGVEGGRHRPSHGLIKRVL